VAAKLAFIQQPTNTTAGNIISPAVTVAVEDQFGNIVTTNNSCVTLALASDPPCNPRLNVTLTAQVRDGVATFNNLLLTAAGTYTFKATDGRLTSVTSSSFQITPAAAVRMVFIESPWLNEPGKKFHVEVELLDKYGNVATNNTSEVTLSLGLHPRGAALSGTMTANVVNGIATFENLSINKLGFYTLFASDSNTGLPVAVIPLLMI
jgi:S-adenosylmethionine hydrolase